MSKKQLLMLLVMPAIQTGITLLRNIDTNDTGADDECAAALELASTRIMKYITQS